MVNSAGDFERDYAQTYAAFDLDTEAAELVGSLSDGINACVETIDRYADTGRVALYWESQDGRSAQYTFAELQNCRRVSPTCWSRRASAPGMSWRACCRARLNCS